MGVIDSIGKAGPLSLRRSVVALADLKAPCGAKGDLELPTLLPPPFEDWDYRHSVTTLGFHGKRD